MSLPLSAARENLITDPKQLTTNSDNDWYTVQKLINGNPWSEYNSKRGELPESPYIQVDLNRELQLEADEDLVVMVQRCDGELILDKDGNVTDKRDRTKNPRQPTAFKVDMSVDGNTWEHFCYVYFLYRGAVTKEFSSRIRTDKPFRYLRFTVTANNSRSHDSNGHRYMDLGEFQIIKLNRSDNYSETFRDRFHTVDDYNQDYAGYEFENTQGVLNSNNRHTNIMDQWYWHPNTDSKSQGWEDGKWTKDTEFLKKNDIKLPDYSFITNEDGNTNQDKDLVDGQKRQPTHTVEHILYAIPGDAVALYPFYAMYTITNYEENFSHWYDWRTGGRLQHVLNKGLPYEGQTYDLLDFLIDPAQIYVSDKYGFFGGKDLPQTQKPDLPKKPDRKYGSVATFLCPRDPYSDGGVMPDLPFRDIDKESFKQDGNGHDEFVIAADFAQDLNEYWNITQFNNPKKILEPTIQFRHIFRIRDGKKFAEEFSGSPENNEDYIRKNMRFVSARAGEYFQIRLDSPIPIFNGTATPRSKYYYKISDTDYRRVCSMGIEAYKVDDSGKRTKLPGTGGFYFDEVFNGQGSRRVEDIEYRICGGGGQYYRMLKLKEPEQGKYIVRIIGHDINDRPIKVYGSDVDLVVMEYVISFQPKTAASVITEDELYSTDDEFKHAREEELDKNYGHPRDQVTFDKYRLLEDKANVGDPTDYLFDDGSKQRRTDRKETRKGYTYIWPTEWFRSTYSFGYNIRHDYNMYMIASHSSQTPYCNAALVFNKNYGEGTGLYDRLFYKTRRLHQTDPVKYPAETIDHGYFYYVNAATDPGVMTRLSIDNMCLGSTVHVSAWVAEFSNDSETANIAFNFIAVMKGTNERIPLHTFTSGYIPKDKCGQWMNIYYSFVPDFTHADLSVDDISHYELELDNNCKSSQGADYAIDNIRIYIIKPVLYAKQMTALCNDDTQNVRVKVESPFNVMLQTIGASETTDENSAGTDHHIYYTFIDKQKFDEEYDRLSADGDSDPGKHAYEKAVLKYNYRGQGEETTFGILTFNSKYSSHPQYDANAELRNTASRELAEDGTRMLVFNTEPKDDELRSGKEYYIAMYVPLSDEVSTAFTPDWADFDIKGNCAKVSTFRVRASNVIKIDGVVREDADNISVCENQSPVAQVNIWGQINGEMREIEKNAYLDWYDGSVADFNAENDNGIYLKDALTAFREYYPDATSVDPDAIAADKAAGNSTNLTMEMVSYLVRITTEKNEGQKNPKLLLMRSSYVFPPISIDADATEKICHVVAIPMEKTQTIGDQTVVICALPTEIDIKVEHSSPTLTHGLREITYPNWMDDVPLRIGLRQLNEVSDDMNLVGEHTKMLNVPVRKVAVTNPDGGVERLRLKPGYPYIYLVETNDPDYKDLGTSGVDGLMAVGEISSLTAELSAGAADANIFSAVFYSKMKFKEGYYYRMRFSFEEDDSNAVPTEPQADARIVCDGQDVFTIKVVPEYQKWTGKTNRNWNNDDNWSRVTSAELYASEEKNALKEFVSDGDNSGTVSYAPLDFTKVIIDGTTPFPYLYELKPVKDLSGSYTDLPPYNNMVKWPEETTAAPEELDAIVGKATPSIHYDMAAYNSTATDGGVNCRPWYANTCEQIHFRPESEIMAQQHLAYRKAWVDVELDHSRWYTLASPLRSTVAGELYLPSDNARQETPLFTGITYDVNKNHRFKPAVFQRGWNKGSAIVYELSSDSRNVAVKADWSHVFNDVTEKYGAGTGFSIKTDVSAMDAPATGKVLFRLPKADKSYDYYTQDYAPGSDGASGSGQTGNNTLITRDGSEYRLNDTHGTITSTTAGEKKYFFIGNPFMTHLDMEKFLTDTENSKKINPKYWLVTGSVQMAGVFGSDGTVEGNAPAAVAPLQGFFVEAKEGAAVSAADGSMSLTLRYDETMMKDGSFSEADAPLKAPSRGVETHPGLVISAMNGGKVSSSATIIRDASASDGYLETEDMTVLDNSGLEVPATVYSVAGDRAVTVNRLNGSEKIGLGVIAGENEVTLLRFGNVAGFDDMMLYDAETGEGTPLSDGMEYQVKGNVSGRLFLTKTLPEETLAAMRWSLHGNELTVLAGAGGSLTVRVHDMAGRTVYTDTCENRKLSFMLEDGVYVMEASDGHETLVAKIIVR